jgi:hypothetical protein
MGGMLGKLLAARTIELLVYNHRVDLQTHVQHMTFASNPFLDLLRKSSPGVPAAPRREPPC